MQHLDIKQHERLRYWYPALLAGLTALIVFVWMGNTPLLRAAAMALVIIGVSLSMRWLNALLAYVGGLALAFSPVYWSQTGGGIPSNTGLILLFIVLAGGGAGLLLGLSRRVFASFAIGLSLFVGLYLAFGVSVRSQRLTLILAAWLLYMLITALRQTNPRPDEPPAQQLSRPHVYGVLLIMALGGLNDPLMTLFAPAAALGLWLSHARLPWWYWLALVVVVAWGLYGISRAYIAPDWLWRSAHEMHIGGQFAPFIVLDGWREPLRWLYITDIVARQFTLVGLLLGVIGIARMSRWYPTLGVTLMTAYASYALFGLVYFGKDAAILLLPMLMIQVICMTYAVYTLIEWGARLARQLSASTAQHQQIGVLMFAGLAILQSLAIISGQYVA